MQIYNSLEGNNCCFLLAPIQKMLNGFGKIAKFKFLDGHQFKFMIVLYKFPVV